MKIAANRRLVRMSALILIAAIAAITLWYRMTYAIWPGQEAGARIHWCGRDYNQGQGSPLTLQQVQAQAGAPVDAVGDYPPLGPKQQLIAVRQGQGGECPAVIYRSIGSGQYLAYGLSGGP